MESFVLLFLVLGLLAGIIAGVFGLGGGILFTPILFLVFNNAGLVDPVLFAIGSSLFCTFVASIGSSLRQYRQHNFFAAEGLKVGLLGAIGVTFGKWVITSPVYNERVFATLFSTLLLYVAFMFYRQGTCRQESPQSYDSITLKQAGVAGGLGGFVAALAGIGGGGVMVPIMNLFYEHSFQKSVSISSLAIVLISLSGWVQLALTGNHALALTSYHLGYVDFGSALPLAAGGLAGGFIGAWLNLKIDRRYLQFAFALLALFMATKLLTETF